MSVDKQSPPPKPFERVMVFIDGGYLRGLCEKWFGYYRINFKGFYENLVSSYNTKPIPFQADLVRIYYYDAIVEEGHPDYKAQRKDFNSIDNLLWYTVKLGRLVESSKKKFKQKGVDVRLAIDALTKAYENHYQTAIFVFGDADYLPLLEAVKDAGKKTLIFCHPPSASKPLLRCADMRIFFNKKSMAVWLKKQL